MRAPAIGLTAVLVVGCHSSRPPDPATALRAQAAALAGDDWRPAYRLLGAEIRGRLPEQDFAARWALNRAERHTTAAALLARADKPIAERAQVAAGGVGAVLEREPAGWRLVGPRLEPPGAPTPEQALEQLLQALEDRSFDAVLHLLGEPLRATIERELATRLEKLRGAAGKGIQLQGDTARLRYDQQYFIEFKQENGQWRISDFN
jgi:hypothetical protein